MIEKTVTLLEGTYDEFIEKYKVLTPWKGDSHDEPEIYLYLLGDMTVKEQLDKMLKRCETLSYLFFLRKKSVDNDTHEINLEMISVMIKLKLTDEQKITFHKRILRRDMLLDIYNNA